VVGHSLGGGVASLIAMLLSGTPELSSRLGAGTRVSAITYAAPPVATEDLAKQSAQSITSVVNQYDMVRHQVCDNEVPQLYGRSNLPCSVQDVCGLLPVLAAACMVPSATAFLLAPVPGPSCRRLCAPV
jgi:hypothetical protein